MSDPLADLLREMVLPGNNKTITADELAARLRSAGVTLAPSDPAETVHITQHSPYTLDQTCPDCLFAVRNRVAPRSEDAAPPCDGGCDNGGRGPWHRPTCSVWNTPNVTPDGWGTDPEEADHERHRGDPLSVLHLRCCADTLGMPVPCQHPSDHAAQPLFTEAEAPRSLTSYADALAEGWREADRE